MRVKGPMCTSSGHVRSEAHVRSDRRAGDDSDEPKQFRMQFPGERYKP